MFTITTSTKWPFDIQIVTDEGGRDTVIAWTSRPFTSSRHEADTVDKDPENAFQMAKLTELVRLANEALSK